MDDQPLPQRESFARRFFNTLASAFLRTLAIAMGLMLALALAIFVFKPPAASPRPVDMEVLPTHEWKVQDFSRLTPTILRINIHGPIGLAHLTRDDIHDILVDSVNGDLRDGQIRGILLNIDSPGGTVDDSDAIYRLINEYKARFHMPVYAYIDGMCASGGMMIACSADKVYATTSSIVGHVGVIAGTSFNVSHLMDSLGIQSLTIHAGKGKDDLNPFRPWKADEGVQVQNLVDAYYQQFLTIVTDARKGLTKESLIDQGACVYPAAQALTLGYIDGFASSEGEVLQNFAKDLGIEDSYQYVEFRNNNWFEDLFASDQCHNLLRGRIEHTLRVAGDIPEPFVGKFLYLYRPE